MTDVKPKKRKYNSITREFVDQDYRKKLSDEEKAWLDAFNDEYYNAIYNEERREIHPKEFDQNLKEGRSARRKDLYGRLYGDRGGTDGLDFDELPETSLYEKDVDDSLHKMETNEAMEVIISQTTDMVESGMYDVKSEIRNAVKRGIKLFISAKKNK